MFPTLAGLAMLAGFQWLGGLAARALHLPLPDALAGCFLLAGALLARGRVPEPVARAADPLLRHLLLFLIPSVTGIAAQAAVLRDHGLALAAVCVAGAAVTMAVSALALALCLRLFGGQS